MGHQERLLRVAAALDYLHGEFDLGACGRVTGAMWREAFEASSQEPNFYEGGRDVGITENLLHREPLLVAAGEQLAQLSVPEWASLGAW